MDTFCLYDDAVPHALASLDALGHPIDKMEAHSNGPKTSFYTLIVASLAPDMALSIASRLGRIQPPSTQVIQPGDPKTLDYLREHVDTMRYMVQRLDQQKLVSLSSEVTWNMGPVEKKTSSAYGFLNGFSTPNMYFHVVTAYDILRNSRVGIRKTDYLNHFLGRYLA